jgi:hypothetical protein
MAKIPAVEFVDMPPMPSLEEILQFGWGEKSIYYCIGQMLAA